MARIKRCGDCGAYLDWGENCDCGGRPVVVEIRPRPADPGAPRGTPMPDYIRAKMEAAGYGRTGRRAS